MSLINHSVSQKDFKELKFKIRIMVLTKERPSKVFAKNQYWSMTFRVKCQLNDVINGLILVHKRDYQLCLEFPFEMIEQVLIYKIH